MKLSVKKIIEWDVPNWSRLIDYWTPILETLPRDSKVLAIGERNGGLSAWLALMGFQVVCTDRELPTQQAHKYHHSLGVSGKISYKKLDIVNCDWPPASYDIIIAKSVIGGLKADPGNRLTRNFEVQKKALDNIYALLKTGGYFFSAENMQGSLLMQYFRHLRNKNDGWRYLSWEELKTLYKKFQVMHVKGFGLLPTNFGYPVLNKACFIGNKYIFNFLPDKYKYISFVAAQKANK